MALFGGSRDINLFHTINSELLKDIIQTEVAYYKFALEQTNANVYGESMGKNYYEPLKIACLISRQDQDWSSDEFGSDINQTIGFQFLKNELNAYLPSTIQNELTRGNLSKFAFIEFKKFALFGYGEGGFESLFKINFQNMSNAYALNAHSDLREFIGEFGLIGSALVILCILFIHIKIALRCSYCSGV